MTDDKTFVSSDNLIDDYNNDLEEKAESDIPASESLSKNHSNSTKRLSDIEEEEDTDIPKLKKLNYTTIKKRKSINDNEELSSSENEDLELTSVQKSYYTSYDLKKQINKLIKLLHTFDQVVFTDDYKIDLSKHFGCFWFFKKKSDMINPKLFPGILFLPYDSINLIKKEISNHNKNKDRKSVVGNQINFDEGDMFKDTVYKKLEIHDNFLFVPLSKFQLKLTEYKLRGFCQIMEELGAKEIEIKFNHVKNKSKKKSLDIKAEDYNYIAGSLGFSANSSNNNENGITYKLTYPKQNTFLLNENILKKRIKKGKYIISKKNFDSNLELQYIISSRCRHFITNYSTVFNLDNSQSYDKKLISKLEAHKMNVGFEANSSIMKNLKLTINTTVKFSSQEESYINLIGNNIGCDAVGFNYLLGSIPKDKFKTEGIIKIYAFLNLYLDKYLSKIDEKNYKQIKSMIRIIDKEFSFDDFTNLMLDYFYPNSHWVHFTNFIDILKFKRISYNKLGFLILMSQKEIKNYKKDKKIIDFIRHIASKENLEKNFWDMLKPNHHYLIIKKLAKDYDILNQYNWFNFKKLIHDMHKYNCNEEDKNIESLFNNFKYGHKNIEFELNIKPYLINFVNNNYELFNIKFNLTPLLFDIIRPRHFINNNINTQEKLIKLINIKIVYLFEASKLIEDLINKKFGINNNDLFKLAYYLLDPTFKNKYPNIEKKIIYLFENNINKLLTFLKLNISNVSYKNYFIDLISKIITFDHKFDVNYLDLNSNGFNLLLKRFKIYKNCIDEDEKIIFFIRLVNFIIQQNSINGSNFNCDINSIDDEIKLKINQINSYEKLLSLVSSFVFDVVGINLDEEFYRLLID